MSTHTNANPRRTLPIVLAALVASLALIAGCDRRDTSATGGTGTTTTPPMPQTGTASPSPPASAASR